ncbi:MAG: DUF1428 domain-containing protein [Phycisphaerae bacterium]|nr:DUF1428 domain-containing protein [Phycisphaerae bacterium]MBN8598392.1 DUF1428 domain-containing protein [Planctomycetota bacterium]
MAYVDGYLIPIPKKSVAAYKKMASVGCKVWMAHGALDYRECVGDDLKAPWGLPFTKLLKTKPSETVVFAWIVFKSKAHRDKVNAAVMKDPRLTAGMDMKKMPFDPKKMCFGGFKTLVQS